MNEAWLAGCELATSVNDYHEVALMRPAFQNEGAGCRRHGHRPPPGHRGGWSGGCAAGEPVTLRWGTGNNLRRDRILSDEKEVLRDLYAFPGTAIANRHKLGGSQCGRSEVQSPGVGRLGFFCRRGRHRPMPLS